jgi:hypothetical protein
VGAQIPLGAGLAFALKYQGKPNVAITMYGAWRCYCSSHLEGRYMIDVLIDVSKPVQLVEAVCLCQQQHRQQSRGRLPQQLASSSLDVSVYQSVTY